MDDQIKLIKKDNEKIIYLFNGNNMNQSCITNDSASLFQKLITFTIKITQKNALIFSEAYKNIIKTT